MGLKFFHLPSHRVFNYTPQFYDPEKEKLEQKMGKKNEAGEYVPGSIVAKGFRRQSKISARRSDSDNGYTKGRRIVVYLLIATIIVALFYFTKSFEALLALMRAQ